MGWRDWFKRSGGLVEQAHDAPPMKKTATRGFSAAQINRLVGEWFATEQSINEELRGDLQRLRARGRDLVKNNDFARKFVAMCEDNIIGSEGVRLQSRVQDQNGTADKMACDAIERAWREWQLVCDIAGKQSFSAMCRTLVGGLPSDGEFLVMMVKGEGAGNRFNFALQIIDVDRIDTSFNGNYGGNTVIMGVEVDVYRRPLALHLYAAHPSDGSRSSRDRVRIPMERMIHGFKLERAEQMRGIPWMAAGMVSLHHLGKFKLSALLAAEHGANHYGFFEKKDAADVVGAPVSGLLDSGDGSGAPEIESVPGMFDVLDQYTFKPFESPYPNQVFAPFVKTTLQRIASGWRISYHSLANDLEGVNFSSIRSGTIEERDRWRVDQQWFVDVFCRPVFLAWLDMALMSGQIKVATGSPLPYSKKDKFVRHDWQPRTWEWVDPEKDINASVMAVNAGFLPPQDIANALGRDFEETLTLIAEAKRMATALGISLPAYDSKPGANSGNAGANVNTSNNGGANASQ